MIRRLLILGCPGSGKSTLAAHLACETGLPLLHLDKIYWQPNWTKPDEHAWQNRLASELSKSTWIIDGNYGATLSMRLQAADAVIMLDYSTATCLFRACRRMLFKRHPSEVALGCPERVSTTLLRYIWHFRRKQRPGLLRELTQFSGSKLVLRSPPDLAAVRELISLICAGRASGASSAPEAGAPHLDSETWVR